MVYQFDMSWVLCTHPTHVATVQHTTTAPLRHSTTSQYKMLYYRYTVSITEMPKGLLGW